MTAATATDLSAPLVSLPNFLSRVNLALCQVPAGRVVTVVTAGVAEITHISGSPSGPAADEAVQAVAEWVLAAAGPADAAALVGGGEFAILCRGVRESGETDTIVRRIRDAMTRVFDVAGAPVSVATATGVAMASAEDTAERLIGAAGRAMRAARHWDAAEPATPVQARGARAGFPVHGAPPGSGNSGGRAVAVRHASSARAADAGMELAETVIGQLFGVGVILESVTGLADGVVAARIRQAIDELDAIIRDARTAAFGGRPRPDPCGQTGSRSVQVKAAAPV